MQYIIYLVRLPACWQLFNLCWKTSIFTDALHRCSRLISIFFIPHLVRQFVCNPQELDLTPMDFNFLYKSVMDIDAINQAYK